jgi:hypothetical protein
MEDLEMKRFSLLALIFAVGVFVAIPYTSMAKITKEDYFGLWLCTTKKYLL